MKRLLELRDKHWEEWKKLLVHPMLQRLASGALSERSTYAWMEQNYRFVEGLLAFQAHLLPRAPRQHRLVLAHGLVGIVEDLDWMAVQPIDTNAPPHPARERYLAFLRMLAQEPYNVGIVSLWMLNRAFHDAWNAAAPRERVFIDLVDHWMSPEFQAYLHDLGEVAEEALAQASDGEKERIDALVQEIIRLERGIWDMTNSFVNQYG
ncbi:hypothetical protein [Oceanithermus sp.]